MARRDLWSGRSGAGGKVGEQRKKSASHNVESVHDHVIVHVEERRVMSQMEEMGATHTQIKGKERKETERVRMI